MTLFELVKQNICVPDAAKHYGLQVNRNGMCSCPFHEDQHTNILFYQFKECHKKPLRFRA